MTENVDQHARDDATDALAKLATHEAVCAERYKNLEFRLAAGSKRMEDISGDIKGVKNDIKAGVVKLILSLFGAVGTMGAALFAMLRVGG
jgi:hypothetical protein